MERVFQHPQIAARNMVEEMQFDAAIEGTIKVIGMSGEALQTSELSDV
jgi:hypothetical protein